MLSMTDADTTISFATPDDVRLASEKAFNIWLGAFSPLWAPFFAATAAGLGFWSMSQAMRRGLGLVDADRVGPDTHLFARWPGFELPLATPWSRGWGEVVEEADRITELAHDALSAPIQVAFEAEETLEAAIGDAAASARDAADGLTPRAGDLFSAAEETNRETAHVVTETVAVTADAAEVTSGTVKTAAEKTSKPAKNAAETIAKSTEAVIDPVTEAPVVPSVAEATAENLPLSLGQVSPAAAPRKPRKSKA